VHAPTPAAEPIACPYPGMRAFAAADVGRFFGRDAAFPQGPLLLAQSLRVPAMLFVGLYEGGARYTVRFEPLCEAYTGDRTLRAAWVRESVQRYADRLEHLCRLAPYNWFNFYDFWCKSPD